MVGEGFGACEVFGANLGERVQRSEPHIRLLSDLNVVIFDKEMKTQCGRAPQALPSSGEVINFPEPPGLGVVYNTPFLLVRGSSEFKTSNLLL